MMFSKVNNDLSNVDDSFLTLERECNMDEKRQTLINANDTMLFDIEPPSLLWNQTENSIVDQLDRTEDEYNDEDGTIEISPVKYIGLIRPSTIIEETSSQFESSDKSTGSSVKSSLYETASINESEKESPNSKSEVGNKEMETPEQKQTEGRLRRGTFAFKRANYTFFPDENLNQINECGSFHSSEDVHGEKPIKRCVEPDTNSTKAGDDEDRFNNTLERVDYLLETGKKILEETPVAKRSIRHQSFLETPHFSCKRKRLINEMASIELLPMSKRGALIDFVTLRKL